ncbi:MAG: FeoA family protein [Sporomusaceae bacterium]|nr:FeoA family protein [Sporomusaceae bacterium]
MSKRTVSSLQAGERARITGFAKIDPRHERNLLALGLFAGVVIDILQIIPTVVIRFEHTQLAIDHRLADCIYVVQEPCCVHGG